MQGWETALPLIAIYYDDRLSRTKRIIKNEAFTSL